MSMLNINLNGKTYKSLYSAFVALLKTTGKSDINAAKKTRKASASTTTKVRKDSVKVVKKAKAGVKGPSRSAQAVELLKTTDLSITAIAKKVGVSVPCICQLNKLHAVREIKRGKKAA